MVRPIKIVLRFLLVMGVLVVLSVVLAPPMSQRSPYLSGLADLTAGSALAAKCGNRVCPLHPRKPCNPVDPSRMQDCVKGRFNCETIDCV
jgi:hypothetical protein